MRLVIIVPRFWPLTGRSQKVLGDLAVELTQRGHEVTVVTARWQPNWPSSISFHEVPVIRLPIRPEGIWNAWRFLRTLSAWLRENRTRYDVVCVSGLKQCAAATVRAVGDDVPVLLRAESSGRGGDCVWQLDAMLGGRIKRQCVKAAALIGTSRLTEEELKAAGYPRARIRRIENGVPIPEPRSIAGQRTARAVFGESNRKFQLVDKAPLAIYAGSIEPRNGVEHLVVAWKTIAAKRPTAQLWLAGDGSSRNAVKQKIDWLKLTGRVIQAGVFSDLDTVFAAADLFALPTLDAGPSLSMLEAMAAGLPVVATDTPGTREVMIDGEHGRVVPPGDTGAMSKAMADLLDRPGDGARMGAAAREHVSQRYSVEKMANRHEVLFDKLI